MAFSNLFTSSGAASAAATARPRDLDDHIGSSGTTTPHAGIATPQPDLTDRRLPGILSSYFGQVRAPSSSSSTLSSLSSPSSASTTTPASSISSAATATLATATATATSSSTPTALSPASHSALHPEISHNLSSSSSREEEEPPQSHGAALTPQSLRDATNTKYNAAAVVDPAVHQAPPPPSSLPHEAIVQAQVPAAHDPHRQQRLQQQQQHRHDSSPLERISELSLHREDPTRDYPTPPLSSASSQHRKSPSRDPCSSASQLEEASEVTATESASVAPPSAASPEQSHQEILSPPSASSSSASSNHAESAGNDDSKAPHTTVSSHSSHPRRTSVSIELLPTKIRRSTLTAAPLVGVLTTSNVEASHFSTPELSSPERPLSPDPLSHSSSAVALAKLASTTTPRGSGSANAVSNLVASALPIARDGKDKLTSVHQSQNTPPQTPRRLSTEPGSGAVSRQTSPPAIRPSAAAKDLRRTSNSHTRAVIGDPKGKLSVTIVEARGLRPSLDPYVVCQFQWNEYISKGPRTDSLDPEDGRSSPMGGVPIRRSDSDNGRPMAIPMRSRQSSHTSISSRESTRGKEVTDPIWNHEAVFDVVGEHSEVDVSVYDNSPMEAFLGHVRFCPKLVDDGKSADTWFKLNARDASEEHVTGEVRLRLRFSKVEKKHYGPEDFQILKLIGKGTFGQVFQVRKRDTGRVYAMKVLSKRVIVQKKEVAHTLGERNILVRTAMTESPFIVGLKFSFQTPSDLYLVTDYMSGGELFWHLQKEGRFNETRAKFYIAELILALQHLHQHDIVYRDLKPENILLDANGHIALCDFGLSKANLAKDDTTNTFCGTTEYLAPEVLLDEQGYTKMVDFWSLGVLVFEMCCGWSPFYAEDTQQMYKNIAFGKVRFPRDALSTEGRNFVKGLLNRNPKHRLGAQSDAEELKAHPFFDDIDWSDLAKKNVVPPFKPKLKSELDTSNFDPEFTNALNGAGSLNARAAALASGIDNATTPLSPTVQANFKGFTFVDESAIAKQAFAQSYRDRARGDDEIMDDDDDEETNRHEGRRRNESDEEMNDDEDEGMSGLTRTMTGGHNGPEDPMFNGDGFD